MSRGENWGIDGKIGSCRLCCVGGLSGAGLTELIGLGGKTCRWDGGLILIWV